MLDGLKEIFESWDNVASKISINMAGNPIKQANILAAEFRLHTASIIRILSSEVADRTIPYTCE